jgi:Fe2+ or Zn2+ uptake regulation protein
VTEIDKAAAAPLVAALDQTEGFLTDVGHLTVFGLCSNCRPSHGLAEPTRPHSLRS